MLLVIDNYDSFVYNLVQYLGELGQRVEVYRNDQITVNGVKKLRPAGIILSPGPGRPEEAGICLELVQHLAGQIPILGVCLGHQVIGQAFGAGVVRAGKPVHGKSSPIMHRGFGLFKNLPVPFTGGRYHSLVLSPEKLPDCLEVTAWTEEGEIMGVAHRRYHVYGVQFHPESVLTGYGHHILKNYLQLIS
ncbi:anthranilate synthase/aminodeoxychorismate synthase-like glutamine amidotransferase [Desulfohalotomaculum tongense]|uniref:anthranilate synthase component II n=1 Tax=Desulforadius tongensis TaxID=1216062 RepID=UPI0019595542|nr:aminodeoxychorismate/anthranilate synthase component II [Desulforadius tongensis]MBM7854655.1 anthranilate synthase/aminodeoxychorismate synthase-like glutamine amidotransferase [Desulforadius tongensis]